MFDGIHTRTASYWLRRGLPMGEHLAKAWVCDVCEHVWLGRSSVKPEKCPRCKSRMWNKERGGYFGVSVPKYRESDGKKE